MTIDTAQFINLYVFPTGRRIYALTEVAKRAKKRGIDDVTDHARGAIAHDRKTLELEVRRKGKTEAHYGPDAQALDIELDRGVNGLHAYLVAQARIFGDDSKRGAAAIKLRRALYPAGALPITSLSFVQETVHVEAMLERIESDELRDAAQELPDLPSMVERIAGVNQRFGQSLHGYAQNVPTPDKVREAQVHGQELLAETVVLILAHSIKTKQQSDDDRQALLEPILRQNDAIRAARRRRRPPLDVDPDSGEEKDSDSDDLSSADPDDALRDPGATLS